MASGDRTRRGLERQLTEAHERIATLAADSERLMDGNMALEGQTAALRQQLGDLSEQNRGLLSEMRRYPFC